MTKGTKYILTRKNIGLFFYSLVIFAFAYLNNDHKAFLIVLSVAIVSVFLRKTIIIKIFPLLALLAIPILIVVKKEALLGIDYRILYDATLLFIWVMIYEYE
ncbi:MAG: hypothetical protein WCO23_03995 [bacterium]